MFAPLREPAEFVKASVQPEACTVARPHDLALCPDVLHVRAHSIALSEEVSTRSGQVQCRGLASCRCCASGAPSARAWLGGYRANGHQRERATPGSTTQYPATST